MKKIQVLVIDDSLFMRNMISDVLNNDDDIDVVAVAKNGTEGIEKMLEYNPDVITLDYDMPGLNGIAILKKIMHQNPTPVVMVSAYTRKAGQITVQALHEGAIDYVLKPSGSLSLDIGKVGEEIIHRVKVAAQVDVDQLLQFLKKKVSFVDAPAVSQTSTAIVIGSSTGGLVGVEHILSSFPADFPASLFVVQHLPELFVTSFAERINNTTSLQVTVASHGEQVQKGVVYIAPGGSHMEVVCSLSGDVCPDGESYIKLTTTTPVCGYRPSISVLMKSVASVYRDRAIGVLLSGMGVDGVEGMEAISQHYGTTMVQDQQTSIVYGMAREAVDIGIVDEILPIDDISKRIVVCMEEKLKK